MSADALPDVVQPARLTDILVRAGVRGYDRTRLVDDHRLSVLWQITIPVWQRAYGIPPVIWWNNLERAFPAFDDIGCEALLD